MNNNHCPIRVAPSILSADFGLLAAEARRTEEAGADWLHCDVMDGHFVPNLTFGPDVIRAIRPATRLPLDVHLMIEHADRYIPQFIEAGADHLLIHVEEKAGHDVAAALQMIRTRGGRPGLVLNPGTPASAVLPYLRDINLVLVMTVEPGFGGQSFMAPMIEKIEQIRAAAAEYHPMFDLAVDGGINPETARLCVAAGANVLVAGSSLYRHKNLDLSAAIRELRDHANSNQD